MLNIYYVGVIEDDEVAVYEVEADSALEAKELIQDQKENARIVKVSDNYEIAWESAQDLLDRKHNDKDKLDTGF